MAGLKPGLVAGFYIEYLGKAVDSPDNEARLSAASRVDAFERRPGTVCDQHSHAENEIDLIAPASVLRTYCLTCGLSGDLTSNRCTSCGAYARNSS
jgi:hypothetical protein